MTNTATRVLISQDPYYEETRKAKLWSDKGQWPCKWIVCAQALNLSASPRTRTTPEGRTEIDDKPRFVSAYRRFFKLDEAQEMRIHVSADERYELFLNGERIGRGPERGDADHWFFETYDLQLDAGEHSIVARVWSLGDGAPYAQMSVYPGFLLSPQEPAHIALLGTGVADWEATVLDGYEWIPWMIAWGTGVNVAIHGERFPWGFELGAGDDWQPALERDAGCEAILRNDFGPLHLMTPAVLPPMLEETKAIGRVFLVSDAESSETHAIPIRAQDDLPEESAAWSALLRGMSTHVAIPPRTRRRVLIDLDDYYCAYPEVTTSGGKGSLVRVLWQESLFDDDKAESKGNRDETENKYFMMMWFTNRDGEGDYFHPDGGAHRRFETLWWQCGRYVEVVVETQDEALTIESLRFRETRYPHEVTSRFESSDARLAPVAKIALRTLQMCSHETYMDCPYYEQLMYLGDTRLQVLTTYAISPDDRLPRKALQMFDWSRTNDGLTQSRYPSRVRQTLRPFALWWVAMIHDFALWRDDADFVRALMPGARIVLDAFEHFVNADGLVELPKGPNFNFMDWVPGWTGGEARDGGRGINSTLNWQRILVLRQMAQLEEWQGEPEMAARRNRQADAAQRAATEAFWDEKRGLFASDLEHTSWNEHAQCLAILADELSGDGHEKLRNARRARLAHGLLQDADLERTTIYFAHYLFETYRVLGRMDAFFNRMEMWFDLVKDGLRTTIEHPEPTRSDCHAWGAHPLYHQFASLLGIRPGAPGFKRVLIAPQLGTLTFACGTMPHPRGEIAVDVKLEGDKLHARIVLPEEIKGAFLWQGRTIELHSGEQEINV